jgi:hypothetical protein
VGTSGFCVPMCFGSLNVRYIAKDARGSHVRLGTPAVDVATLSLHYRAFSANRI